MSTSIEVRRTQPGVARVAFRSENGIQILSRAVCRELRDILKQLRDDAQLRIVVFEAEGRTFLAGADLHELQALNVRTAYKYSQSGQRLFQRIARLPAVSICAIHAACAGGGCELALACDMRLAAAGARIGLPEVTLGLIPGWGGLSRATRMFGPSVARRIVLSGKLFDAGEATRLGLVDAVFPDDQFRAAVDRQVAEFLKAEPQAVERAKLAIDDVDEFRFEEQLEMEAELFANCFDSDEPHEGLSAFLEKRPARWVGAEPPEPS